jgi:hypothetical protein
LSGPWSALKIHYRRIKRKKGGERLLIPIIRDNNQHDYIMDFMLDSLIDSKKIVKFKRKTGWVNIATDPIRARNRYSVFNDSDRRAANNSTFVHHYLRSNP